MYTWSIQLSAYLRKSVDFTENLLCYCKIVILVSLKCCVLSNSHDHRHVLRFPISADYFGFIFIVFQLYVFKRCKHKWVNINVKQFEYKTLLGAIVILVGCNYFVDCFRQTSRSTRCLKASTSTQASLEPGLRSWMLTCFAALLSRLRRRSVTPRWTSRQYMTSSWSEDRLVFQRFRSCCRISSMAANWTSRSIQTKLWLMEQVYT